MLMVMLRLITLVALIDDDNRRALGLVVVAAFPVLLVAPLPVPEVSYPIVDEKMLTASFRRLVVHADTC